MFDWYDEDDWQKFREECLIFTKNREETVIKEWLNGIGYKEPIGYYRNCWKREFEIYTKRPGCLIGKAGVNVETLKKMLSKEFGGEWQVKFIEVRGGFIGI